MYERSLRETACETFLTGQRDINVRPLHDERLENKFPWGLYKVENLAAVLTSVLIFFSAYEIAKTAVLSSDSPLRNLEMTLFAVFAIVIPIVLFAIYERRIAREINSPSLTADAEYWKADIAPIAIVAAGIAGAKFSYTVMDRVAAFMAPQSCRPPPTWFQNQKAHYLHSPASDCLPSFCALAKELL
ncbi:MAG: cation transporter [Nitrospirae bacterium]|nr:cation transporter [Nitrospirota bacterium]